MIGGEFALFNIGDIVEINYPCDERGLQAVVRVIDADYDCIRLKLLDGSNRLLGFSYVSSVKLVQKACVAESDTHFGSW